MTDARVAAIRREGPNVAFGSGYLIADRLVLTAAHVADTGILQVRLGEQVLHGRAIWSASAVDGDSRKLDAALVEIDDDSYRSFSLPRIRWGRIAGRSPDVGCTATGFPDAMVSPSGQAEPQQITGTVNPLSRGRRGMLDIIPASWPEPKPAGRTLWSGMSGAAVFSTTGQLLIGVVIEAAPNFGDRLLTMLPISMLRSDRSFLALAERHGENPFWLEPVELEPVLRPWHRAATPLSPAALLRPEQEVVPFHGRGETLDHLVTWCESDPQVLGLLLCAPGGTGKTRLARELARVMYQREWTVGELSDRTPSLAVGTPNLAALTQVAGPLLLWVDYADSRADTTGALLRFLAESRGPDPVRVLLLARSAGQWWETLLYDDGVAAVLRDPPCELDGIEYQEDSVDQLAMMSDSLGSALARVPGYEGYQRAAFQLPWDSLPAGMYHPLSLQVAVLAGILARQEDVDADVLPEQVLLRHEKLYWKRLAEERSVGFGETRAMVLVFCLLCGAHSKPQALRTIALLPGFQSESMEDDRRALAHWIATLYPPADPRSDYWGVLAPDWLFEHLLAETVREEPGLLENLDSICGLDAERPETVLTRAQLFRAITVLTAAAAHETEAAGALRQTLYEFVALHNGLFIPLACAVSMQALDPAPLVAALAVIVNLPSMQFDDLCSIRRFIPPAEGALSALGLTLQERAVSLLRGAGETARGSLELAVELDLLSIYLTKNRLHPEAVAASAESTDIYRRNLGAQDENIRLGYANALVNYASHLSSAENWEQSYLAACQAIDLVGQSVHPSPGSRPLLTAALNCIHLYHSSRGDADQAREALARAVALQREQVSSSDTLPLFDRENLSQLLANEATWQSAHGSRAGALRARTESVDIARQLYLAEPGSYADAFQAQAIVLAGLLSEDGQHPKAAALYGEAAEALRRLWNDDRPSYQLKLGFALVCQAEQLSQAGVAGPLTVHLLERSCGIVRDLFRRDPALSARHYVELLKYFVQGAQLVAGNYDVAPHMTEVAGALDFIILDWETAGQIPDDAMTVRNLGMYLSWTIEAGNCATTVRLCERVETLVGEAQDESEEIERTALHGVVLMLKAKALARLADSVPASGAALSGARLLEECSSPDKHMPAYVAAEGLADVARYLAGHGAPAESLVLSSAGISLSKKFLASDRYAWTPLLASHLMQMAILKSAGGEHAGAAVLAGNALELIRWLAEQDLSSRDTRIVGFNVQGPPGPDVGESLDQALCVYARELSELFLLDDLEEVLAELVELRRKHREADPSAERALRLADAAQKYARHLMDGGHPEEAVAAARASLKSAAIQRPAREDLRLLGSILHHDGRILTQAGLFEEALKAISASISTYRAVIGSGGCPRREIAAALTDQSMVLAKTQQHGKSLIPGEEALQIWRELAAAGSSEDQHCLAAALRNRIVALHGLGRIDEALELLSEHQSLTADFPIT